MKKVAILGGGLAGLTCAFLLKQQGIHCTVFEAANMAGGRGPASAYLLGRDVYTNTFKLIDSLGLHDDVVEIPPVAGQYYKGRVYHHRVSSVTGLLGFKGLHLTDKAMLSRMAYLLVKYGAQLDFHRPEKGGALDDETTATFVKRELSQNILNYVAGPLISTLFYYSSEETSKLLYLNLAKHMYSIHMYSLRGGLKRLVVELAQRVNPAVGRQVTAVVVDGSEYRVDGEAFSDLVLAVPGDDVLKIDGIRDLLEPADQEFFETCRYGRALSITFQANREVDRCYALAIPRVERMRAATVVFHDFINPENVRAGRRQITVIGGGDAVTADDLVADFARIYGMTPEKCEVQEWNAAMPKFPPGRYRDLAGFLSRVRRSGLHFCGDYMMGPFIEAAVTTGERVANLLTTSEPE